MFPEEPEQASSWLEPISWAYEYCDDANFREIPSGDWLTHST